MMHDPTNIRFCTYITMQSVGVHTFAIEKQQCIQCVCVAVKYVKILSVAQKCFIAILRGGADKSLDRPTSRCRRTETIVSFGKRCLFMCRIASLFLLQRLKGSMSGNARDFNNMVTEAVIKIFFPPARRGAEGNSRHSDRNIRGICTIVCHRQKLGGPV